MKALVQTLVLLFSLCAGVFAQSALDIVASPLAVPPEEILKDFALQRPNITDVEWNIYKIGDNVHIYGDFTDNNGNKKRVYYKNRRFDGVMSFIPTEYCPKAIKALSDSLCPSYKMEELGYLQCPSADLYRVCMTKGKKKRQSKAHLFFTSRGLIYMNSTERLVNYK